MRPAVFGKSVQGASHIRSNTECQDNNKKIICDDGTVILAVADGHGSKNCPYSRTGSKIAVNVFCDILCELYKSYQNQQELLLSYLNREGDTTISKAVDSEWKRRVIERHKKNKREIKKLPNGEDDLNSVFKQYGSTLLGVLITEEFIFAFQLGDGDICYVDSNGLEMVIEPDKILGVETHSLSRDNAWEKVITVVRRMHVKETAPALFCLSTDGYANSYKTEEAFHSTITEYLSLLNEHGAKVIEANLHGWLSETSSMGCGDDITFLAAYYSQREKAESIGE